MTSIALALLSLPAYALMLWPLVVAARRVLGVRIHVVRALLGAVIGWLVAGGIVALLPDDLRGKPGVLVGLLIPILGGAFLATLTFLFLAEMAVPSGGGLGAFGRIRSIRGRVARARRYSQVMRIAVRHGIGPYLTGRGQGGAHRQAALAVSLRRALEDAGVTFVKLGQVLSTRPDVLPAVFVEELSLLQDQVGSVSFDEVEQVLVEELGRPLDEVFEHLDREPIAAASVAQVYRGTLRTGEDVVLKVRRPDIERLVRRDLDIVHRVARSLDARADWARALGVIELADGFAAALTEELDFRVEARNISAVTAAYSGADVALPTVHAELSTSGLLVMHRLDGSPVRAAAPAVEPARRQVLARSLLDCVLRQVLLHGVFHADPHPGNVLLLADGRLGLLDFGSVGRLDSGLRDGLRGLLVAVDRGDPAAMRDGLLEIVERPDVIDEQRLERALGALVAKHVSHGQQTDASTAMFVDLFGVVAEFRLSVPPPIAAVFRALATMEGTLALLSPGFDILAESRRFASALFGEAMRPESLRRNVSEELTALLPVLRRLPRRIDRIGGALEQGRLSVNVRLLADERDRAVITGWLHEVLLAFTGIATGLMAALLLSSVSGPTVLPGFTVNHLFGYNLLVISALVGLRLLFTVFRSQRQRYQRSSRGVIEG
ncbi:ubiquinone biosynthesis protein [Herbihabitans rhizosphaerae]|uniref:Ubiquinone biosynthesis protein n=1 Tax=Herbihabitans rhizosphaerae TaxID=1872711 RepID=A0A4Q7L808_9PSEU|nr:AarF/UbiB family protein [Herbihabitans rhizosphaerae]RZS44781.1 ubiquinone biosynthesis protein [Herbihabitans rhizosphaerae]